jgi:hypothetical protein
VFEKSKCFILKTNSATPIRQDLGGITSEDNDSFAALTSQLIAKGIFPFHFSLKYIFIILVLLCF